MLDSFLLRRFVEHSEALPGDVRAWALDRLLASVSATDIREERDRLIRAAAALVPGAPWTRARRLHGIAREVSRALPAVPVLDSPRGYVAAAMLLQPGRIPCVKTIARIISDTQKRSVHGSRAKVIF